MKKRLLLLYIVHCTFDLDLTARQRPRDRPMSLHPVFGYLVWMVGNWCSLTHSKGKAGEREEVTVREGRKFDCAVCVEDTAVKIITFRNVGPYLGFIRPKLLRVCVCCNLQ